MKWMRAQASVDSPEVIGLAPPSSACGGRTRSITPAIAARRRGPGFNPRPPSPFWRAMTAQPPRLFDRALHRRRLDRAAAGFSAAGFLKERAAVDAVERLEA